jgi:hypothetical protein
MQRAWAGKRALAMSVDVSRVKGQEMRRTLIADALKGFGGMTDSLGTRPSLCPPAP